MANSISIYWMQANPSISAQTAPVALNAPVRLGIIVTATAPQVLLSEKITWTSVSPGFVPTTWMKYPNTSGAGLGLPVPSIGVETVASGTSTQWWIIVDGYFTTPGYKIASGSCYSEAVSDGASAVAGPTYTGVPLYVLPASSPPPDAPFAVTAPLLGSIDLVDTDNTTVLQAALEVEPGANWGDDENDAASFQVVIPENAVDAALATEGRYLRFKVNGTADRTGIIERVEATVKSTRPNELKRVVSGRDWLCEFEDALVDPPLGIGFTPAASVVRFDWTHPGLALTSAWTNPYYVGPLFSGDIDPFGNPLGPATSGKFGINPEGWPDVFTGWIWSTPLNGSNSHPTGSYSYFALNLILAGNKMAVPIFTADDMGQLAVDGAVVDEGAVNPTIQWQKCVASGIPNVSAGTHYFRVRAINNSLYGATNNPGGVALVVYQNSTDTRLSYTNVVARTGSGVTGTPLVGGGWKCLHAPSTPPGFTPGHAFRLLFESAQAGGALPGWTLGFNDLVDSDGTTWTKTDALTARVNDDTLLDVLRSWASQGYIDFAARASTRVLDMYVWRQRGNYHTSPVSPVVWSDGQLSRAVVEGRR